MKFIKGNKYIIEDKDTDYDFDNVENVFEYLYIDDTLYCFKIISKDANMVSYIEWLFDKHELTNIRDIKEETKWRLPQD